MRTESKPQDKFLLGLRIRSSLHAPPLANELKANKMRLPSNSSSSNNLHGETLRSRDKRLLRVEILWPELTKIWRSNGSQVSSNCRATSHHQAIARSESEPSGVQHKTPSIRRTLI